MAWKVTALPSGQISMRTTIHRWLRATVLYQQPEDTLRHREGEFTLILGKFQMLSCYLLGIMENYSIENNTANDERRNISPLSTFFPLSFPSNNVVCPGISDLMQGLAYSESLGAVRSGDRIPVGGGRDFLQA